MFLLYAVHIGQNSAVFSFYFLFFFHFNHFGCFFFGFTGDFIRIIIVRSKTLKISIWMCQRLAAADCRDFKLAMAFGHTHLCDCVRVCGFVCAACGDWTINKNNKQQIFGEVMRAHSMVIEIMRAHVRHRHMPIVLL